MIDEKEIETYLSISPNNFGIYLFDKKKLTDLYKEELNFENNSNIIDLNILNKFLEDNIFKIEKSIGKFIKNIFLIIDDNKMLNLNIGIKKKNYKKKIDKKFLENSIAEAKDLVSEAYLENKIMHIIIETFLIKKKYYQTFEENLYGDQLSLEISFLMIPNSFISKVESVVEKYQIKISGCLNKNYITNFFNKNNLELSEKAYKIQLGCNVNEVQIVPKNYEKKGFFEKFFQFFS
tara:strand:+ start:495 stop:1199 length:705 start_codon:yes stop_codon:yes gene_type:complete